MTIGQEAWAGEPVGAPASGAHPDELALWDALTAGDRPRHAAERLGIPSGRAVYLCLKWATRGIYEYGTSADMGWPIGMHRTGPVAIHPI